MGKVLTDASYETVTEFEDGDLLMVVRPGDGADGTKKIDVDDAEASFNERSGKHIWVFAGQMLEVQASNSIIAGWMPCVDVTIPSADNLSCGTARTVPTGDTTFSIRKNGVEVGTMTILTGQNDASFNFPGDVSLIGGTDYLTVHVPASADATLELLFFSIYGTR